MILVDSQFTAIFLVNSKPTHSIIKRLSLLQYNLLDINNLAVIHDSLRRHSHLIEKNLTCVPSGQSHFQMFG